MTPLRQRMTHFCLVGGQGQKTYRSKINGQGIHADVGQLEEIRRGRSVAGSVWETK
jgi:hypothetical protein